jgi:GTPase SAR1 family protein
MPVNYSFSALLGKKVLITGDVGAGKTRLTVDLLEEAITLGYGDEITIIDMAPATIHVDGMRVGGKLSEFTDKVTSVRYLAPRKVETPRLSAKSTRELLHLVDLNEKRIRRILNEFVKTATAILFVNDISIYFQSGVDEPIQSALRTSETFIANGYYGTALSSEFETSVSESERRLMTKLADNVDLVISL